MNRLCKLMLPLCLLLTACVAAPTPGKPVPCPTYTPVPDYLRPYVTELDRNADTLCYDGGLTIHGVGVTLQGGVRGLRCMRFTSSMQVDGEIVTIERMVCYKDGVWTEFVEGQQTGQFKDVVDGE